jgi:hypothetical protein
MGTYWRWKCDSRKEFLDPGELLGPECEPGRGYGVKGDSVPHSAWAVATLMLDRWHGCPVRLVPDGSDDYDCDGFEEVSQSVLRRGLHDAPLEALRFLKGEAQAAPQGDYLVGWSPEERAEREELSVFLLKWSEKDWPRLCTTPGCRHYGGRHDGDCELDPEVEDVREYPKIREYALGMGKVVVGPGESGTLRVSYHQPRGAAGEFYVERIIVLEQAWGKFDLQRVTVGGGGLQVEQEILLAGCDVGILGNLPANMRLRDGQAVEIVARNISDSSEVFIAGLYGTVKCGLKDD